MPPITPAHEPSPVTSAAERPSPVRSPRPTPAPTPGKASISWPPSPDVARADTVAPYPYLLNSGSPTGSSSPVTSGTSSAPPSSPPSPCPSLNGTASASPPSSPPAPVPAVNSAPAVEIARGVATHLNAPLPVGAGDRWVRRSPRLHWTEPPT